MTITIHFQGPSLFVTRGETVDCVLIPDGRRTVFKNGQPGRHPDNDHAKRHYAGLVVFHGSGDETARVSLHGKIVTVSDGTGATCAVDPTFAHIVPLDALTNGPDPAEHLRLIHADNDEDYWVRVAARVRVQGGTVTTLEPDPDVDDVFSFPNTHNPTPLPPQPIPILTTWDTTQKAVQIEILDILGRGDPVAISLASGETAFIYNHDKPRPKHDQLFGERGPCPPRARLVDRDFKWLYQLLEPPGGDWDRWLRGHKLPAPFIECPAAAAAETPSRRSRSAQDVEEEALHAGVSTGYGARWTD